MVVIENGKSKMENYTVLFDFISSIIFSFFPCIVALEIRESLSNAAIAARAIFILFLNNPIPSADFMTCDPSMTGRVQNGAFEFMILSYNISYTSSYFF